MKKKNAVYKQKKPRKTISTVYVCLMLLSLYLLGHSVVLSSAPATAVSGFPPTSYERDGWEPIDSGVTQNLNSVFFICLNRGSVVGNQGVILRTGDGGDSWTAQNSGVTENIYDIYYFDYTIVLAVGTSGTILFTTDTGQNWTIVQTGMMGTYYSGQMITDSIGVAVGVNAIFQPFFTRTNDGWTTWQSSSFYIEDDNVFYEGRLTDVYFKNESVGFATAIVDVPAGGAIVRTIDGGATWETVLFYDEALFSIDFNWEGVGYAVGDHGTIVQTTDDGETWVELETGINTRLRAIDFTSETTGTAVGENGMVLRTENEGVTWEQQTSGTASDLYDVKFITQHIGFIVGAQGLILRTNTGGHPDDTTPPETTCTLSGIMEGDVYISDVTVNLTAVDDYSGVATTMYKLDDANWTMYETEPVVVTTDGDHVLLYYSIDNAGNIEEAHTSEFIIQHPANLQVVISGGVGITVTVENLGSLGLSDVSWELLLDGGLILLGKEKSGTIDIPTGNKITLRSLVIGVGKPTVTFTIEGAKYTTSCSVFLFFVRI